MNNAFWPGWQNGKRIGRGAFSSVYEIYREQYGFTEKAAVKVITVPQNEDEVDLLRVEGLDDESITTKFKEKIDDIAKEYRLMIGLRGCINVVHCEDILVVQFDEGLGWKIHLKMELLTPLLKATHLVKSEKQIVKFAMDMCNALAFCHKKHILHRDIKPQNIFVDEEGNFKLGDFGISRTISATVTEGTVGVGTYNYMPPEIMHGSRPYGVTADIYSLGLVLYWLLNERRGPFLPKPPAAYSGLMEEDARRRRFSGEQLPPPSCGRPEMIRIVLKACAYNPEERYQSAQEMYADLKKLYDGLDSSFTASDDNRTVNTVLGNKTYIPQSDVTVKDEKTEHKSKTGHKPPKQPDKPSNPVKPPMKWLVAGVIVVLLLLIAFLCGTLIAHQTEKNNNKQAQGNALNATASIIETSPEEKEPVVQNQETEAIGTALPETKPAVIETEPARTEAAVAQVNREYVQVDGGLDHTVVLFNDGTVEAVGSNSKGQCNVSDWTDIIQISTMRNHTVGLRENGTVVAVGENSDGQCDVSGWSDIIAISAGEHHTVGLCSDGTVVTVGRNQSGECDVQGWSDIVAIGAAYTNTFGLCSDGTVVVTGSYRKGKIPGWENIQSISVSDAHIVGLLSDGTVKAVGNNNHKQCDLSDWHDIVAISAGCAYTTGLKKDGSVVVEGINDVGQYKAKQWNDIAYIATGLEHIIGVKQDGTFVAVGANDEGQCNVSGFSQE